MNANKLFQHGIIISIVCISTTTLFSQSAKMKNSFTSSTDVPIQYLKMDTVQIAYKVIGNGKPVFFLNRFRGTISDWDPAFVDGVARNFKVILFDAPGVGKSSGLVPTSITMMAEQARLIARALGYDHANYLGWSMGGAIAQALVIDYPESVDKLALLATGPSMNPEFVPGNPEFGIRARKLEYDFEDNQFLFFYHSPSAKEACASYLKRLQSIKEKDIPVSVESYKNMGIALGDFKANKEKNYFEQLKNIQQPVLIGNGKFDPSYPLMNSYILEREIPNAKLVIYPDAGHAFLFQHIDSFVTELTDFLK